jgi:hypothetical protein
VLNTAGHPDRIDLPCGNYYLNGFSLSGSTAIVAHGHVAIYIDGNIDAQSNLTITLDPNSELDVFVSGTVTSGSNFSLGSVNYPALTRLYVGSSAQLELSSSTVIAGNVYAPNATVLWTSGTDMFGSVLAGDFSAQSDVTLHHDERVLRAGDSCEPPGTPSGSGGAGGAGAGGANAGGAGGGSAGSPPATCNSCVDCGNQACTTAGACGACTTSADCCAPLICRAGTCISISLM